MAHNHAHHKKTTFHIIPIFGNGLTARLFALANILLSFSNLLTTLRNIGQPDVETEQRDEIHQLRTENFRLKNEREYIRQGSDHNRTLEGDLKIELLKLKIAREQWEQDNAGITAPKFLADDYADPGDVRRGKLPPTA